MKFASVLLFTLASTAVSTDLEQATDAVTVKFMGASGGMKLYKTSDSANFIMVQQNKLQEYTADGDAVNGNNNKITMAGGDAGWTDVVSSTVGGVNYYTTTFSKTQGDKKFSLTAHIAKGEVTVTEEVPCSSCASGSGVCKSSTDDTCSDKTSGACADGSAPCTESVTVPKDELKFSIVIEGWAWAADTNHLWYELEFKQKDGGAAPTVDEATNEKSVVIAGSKVIIPTQAKLVGGTTAAETVDVAVSTSTQGSKYIIKFDFSHFGDRALYYDPTLAMSGVDMVMPSMVLTLTALLSVYFV